MITLPPHTFVDDLTPEPTTTTTPDAQKPKQDDSSPKADEASSPKPDEKEEEVKKKPKDPSVAGLLADAARPRLSLNSIHDVIDQNLINFET